MYSLLWILWCWQAERRCGDIRCRQANGRCSHCNPGSSNWVVRGHKLCCSDAVAMIVLYRTSFTICWSRLIIISICLHMCIDRLGKRELACVESVGLALCVSKPSVAVCRRKHNNKLLNIWTTIPFLWFSVPLCIRFCVLAHVVSDVFALSCFVTSVNEQTAFTL